MTRTSPDLRLRQMARIVAAVLLAAGAASAGSAEPNFPITPQQRSTAQQVAQAGVPLSELAPNAPDAYTVKRGDTLWDISALYLKRPWRWPELWGMNLEQIRNPHLIYPGQVLLLERDGDRARLRVAGGPSGTDKLSPRVRDAGPSSGPIGSVPIRFRSSICRSSSSSGFSNSSVYAEAIGVSPPSRSERNRCPGGRAACVRPRRG